MFKVICVTNRSLCDDLISRIKELHENGAEVILREKDLTEKDYERLAKEALSVCPDITLHTFITVAKSLGTNKIHLPLHLMNENIKNDFQTIGVSVHGTEEAKRAEQIGATYITAGHIFVTDCKKDLEPRGLDFLKEVRKSVNIPVYAIGGISPVNIHLIKEAGADGACIMSGFMRCENVGKYMEKMSKFT